MNLETHKKEDSGGYVAVRLLGRFLMLSDAQKESKSSPRAFSRWAQEVFQIYVSKKSGRMMPIIRHKEFREVIYQFCCTRYGEKVFSWTLAQKLVGSKLDEIWIGQFRAFLNFANLVLGEHASTIALDDWQKIFELGPGRPDTQLRLLFFPDKSDYWDAEREETRRNTWPLDPETDFPKLNEALTFQTRILQFRRPLFLARLDEKTYKSVFWNLRTHRDLYCPTWSVFFRLENQVSSKLKNILHHVMSWVDKDWKAPTSAQNDRKDGKWSIWIKKALFVDSTIPEGSSRPYTAHEATDEFFNQKTLAFIQELWNQVESDSMWRDVKISAEQIPFGKLPGWTDFSRDEAPEIISSVLYPHVNRYMERFKIDCWARLIQEVVRFAGPCLDGWMARFNNPQYLEQHLRPFNAFGGLFQSVNYENNHRISKIPCLTSMQFQSSLKEFEEAALWFYVHLKEDIKNTLEHGFKYNTLQHKANRPHVYLIEDEAKFAEAKNLLEAYSMILIQCGYPNDPDDLNEVLDALQLAHRNEKPAQPIPKRHGLMSDFAPPEDQIQETYDNLKGGHGKDALSIHPRRPNKKRPAVEDPENHKELEERCKKQEEQRNRQLEEYNSHSGSC